MSGRIHKLLCGPPLHSNALGTSQADPNGIQSESGALGSPRKGGRSRTEQKR